MERVPVPGSPQSRVERGHASDSNARHLLSGTVVYLFEAKSLRAGRVHRGRWGASQLFELGAVATRQVSRKLAGQPPDPIVRRVPTPSHSQHIAHRGACGKTRVVPQNRWSRPELTEMGVAKYVCCCRRMGSRGDVEPRGHDDGQKSPPDSSRWSRRLAARNGCKRVPHSHS